MQMSGSCHKSFGFSLLELLVVLGLVSVVSAVAFPGLLRLYQSVSGAVALEEIVVEINRLGRKSFESGKPFQLTSDSLFLPEGWQIVVPVPITYTAAGVCRGGAISIIKDSEVQRRGQLLPPYCQLAHED